MVFALYFRVQGMLFFIQFLFINVLVNSLSQLVVKLTPNIKPA